MSPLLVVFDCDGTLVDSQHVIVAGLTRAFEANQLPPPSAARMRSIVGLSLVAAFARLVPEAEHATHVRLAAAYRDAWAELRRDGVSEPLYPGTRAAIEALATAGHCLAVATGKSYDGLIQVLDHHRLTDHFASLHTADRHPGKPHPAMLEEAILMNGGRASDTIMVGDTSFDMEMARAAGVRPVGVAWGYHPVAELEAAGAGTTLERFEQLPELVAELGW